MTLQELKAKATASELALIEATIKAHDDFQVDQEMKRFTSLLDAKLSYRNPSRSELSELRLCFESALKEFEQSRDEQETQAPPR